MGFGRAKNTCSHRTLTQEVRICGALVRMAIRAWNPSTTMNPCSGVDRALRCRASVGCMPTKFAQALRTHECGGQARKSTGVGEISHWTRAGPLIRPSPWANFTTTLSPVRFLPKGSLSSSLCVALVEAGFHLHACWSGIALASHGRGGCMHDRAQSTGGRR